VNLTASLINGLVVVTIESDGNSSVELIPYYCWERIADATGMELDRQYTIRNPPAITSSLLNRMTDAQLMLRFQSLGENCEFGIVQRKCGAEPLGLLRFAATLDRNKLVEGLRAGFSGLDELDNLSSSLIVGLGLEYGVHSARYALVFHTWILENQATAEEMHARERKRLAFLKRKFFEDLEDAEKLWVYKSNEPAPIEEIWPLVEAIRVFGDNTLLWVVAPNAEHPPGTVIRLGEALLRGHIDRFAPHDDATNVSVAGWIAVCRNAYVIWRPEAALYNHNVGASGI
jgi:hypothetical protein